MSPFSAKGGIFTRPLSIIFLSERNAMISATAPQLIQHSSCHEKFKEAENQKNTIKNTGTPHTTLLPSAGISIQKKPQHPALISYQTHPLRRSICPPNMPIPDGCERATYVSEDGKEFPIAVKPYEGDQMRRVAADARTGVPLEPQCVLKKTPVSDVVGGEFVLLPASHAGLMGGSPASIKEISPPSFYDENPSEHNARHLEYVIQKVTGKSLGEMGFQLTKDLAAAAVSITAGLVATRVAEQFERESAQVVGSSLAVIIFPQLKPVIERFAKYFLPFETNEVTKCKMVFEKVAKDSENLLSQLSRHIQNRVQRLDDQIKESLKAMMEGKTPVNSPKTVEEVYEWLYVRQCYWLGQPRVFRNYMKTLDKEKRDRIIQRQPEAGREATADIFRSLLASSLRGSFGPARLQYLFVGKPGTGKTTLLQYIADALGAPLVMLNYEALSIEDLSGEQPRFEVKEKLPGEPRRVTFRGKLRDKVRETGIKNPIVAIDEFSMQDHSNNFWKAPQLKKLLNREKLEEAGPGEEDLSGVSFFILTNDENIDPAIKSRLIEKKFPDLDTQSHTNARDEQIAAFIAQYRKANENSSEPQQEKELMTEIINESEKEINQYKDLMLALNKDPGARTIKLVAAETLDLIITEKFLHRDPNYKVPEADLEKLIARRSGTEEKSPDDQVESDETSRSDTTDKGKEREEASKVGKTEEVKEKGKQKIRSMLDV